MSKLMVAVALAAVWVAGCGNPGADGPSGRGGATGSSGTGGGLGGTGGGPAGTGGGAAGAAGSPSGGAGGSNAGAGGRGPGGRGGNWAGAVCPGAAPLSGGMPCRTQSECPSAAYFCVYEITPSLTCGLGPPPPECQTDGDCSTGLICLPASGCGVPPRRCMPACTSTSCAADQRCDANGHCTPIACANGGYTCPAALICTDEQGRAKDGHGCAARRCTEGFTCSADRRCMVGQTGADANGCVLIPCPEHACPVNYVCMPGSSAWGCQVKTCTTDGDCDCGVCAGGRCASRAGVCIQPAA